MALNRATLIELWDRVIKFDIKEKIYHNGENNLYPNEIERVVSNSPSASRAATMFAKFIAGDGIIGVNEIVNKKKQLKLSDVIQLIADDISVHYGCFIHIGYGLDERGNLTPNKLDTLSYPMCRIGKPDDEGNAGKVIYKDFESKKSKFARKSGGEDSEKEFYPFNNDEKIVLAQMNADTPDGDLEAKIKNYRGQVLYLNLTPKFKYAVSKFDAVFNDCDTEYRMGLYANTVTRGGFLGKTAVLTNGLDSEQAKKVEDDLKKWLGAENSSHLYHLDLVDADDLDKVLKIIQVESQYDDDMFVNTDKRVRRNILGAANNIPEPLVYSAEGALFGTAGETYQEMKKFYFEQTQSERSAIETALAKLGYVCEIKTLDKALEDDNTIKTGH